MENDVLYNRIMNVIHEEYGEGSTAVANPEGEATDDLEKIQIGDEIYNIAGGGGNSMVIVNAVYDNDRETYVLDKTYEEIAGLLISKTIVYAYGSFQWLGTESDAIFWNFAPVLYVGYDPDEDPFLQYKVGIYGYDTQISFASDAADGVLILV